SMGNLREDVEAHERPRVPPAPVERPRERASADELDQEPSCDDQPPCREVDVPARILDEGHGGAALELDVVVGRARMHFDDATESRAVLVDGLEPDELEYVEAIGIGRRELGRVDRQLDAAGDLAVEPDRAPGATCPARENDCRRHTACEDGCADLPAAVVRARALDHEGAVEPVRAPAPADRDEHALALDLEHEALVASGTGGADEGPQRAGDA